MKCSDRWRRQELNRAVTGERSDVSAVTRQHEVRTGDIAGAVCDKGGDAVAIGGIRTFGCTYRDDSEQQRENQNQSFDGDKTFHDDLLHIDSNYDFPFLSGQE